MSALSPASPSSQVCYFVAVSCWARLLLRVYVALSWKSNLIGRICFPRVSRTSKGERLQTVWYLFLCTSMLCRGHILVT